MSTGLTLKVTMSTVISFEVDGSNVLSREDIERAVLDRVSMDVTGLIDAVEVEDVHTGLLAKPTMAMGVLGRWGT